jgi:RecJ-like exonuclease
MIILKCRVCNGTGEILNEQFQICQAISSHEIKRYFHLPTEDQVDEDTDRQHDACRNIPEKITCPVCEGNGSITFDEDEWELRIVADEDEQSGEG